MKFTRTDLRRLIKEELEAFINAKNFDDVKIQALYKANKLDSLIGKKVRVKLGMYPSSGEIFGEPNDQGNVIATITDVIVDYDEVKVIATVKHPTKDKLVEIVIFETFLSSTKQFDTL